MCPLTKKSNASLIICSGAGSEHINITYYMQSYMQLCLPIKRHCVHLCINFFDYLNLPTCRQDRSGSNVNSYSVFFVDIQKYQLLLTNTHSRFMQWNYSKVAVLLIISSRTAKLKTSYQHDRTGTQPWKNGIKCLASEICLIDRQAKIKLFFWFWGHFHSNWQFEGANVLKVEPGKNTKS